MPRWALPDYVEDLLPAEALRVERARRVLIDTCIAGGFSLVQPPLVEYVDALAAGTVDLDDHMFKVIDQLSGRLLGIRPDMTPQAARIDAHLFSDRASNRLCYAGSVLHTMPTALNPTREIVQGGAELYGIAGAQGDEEVLKLLANVCAALAIDELHIDFGHSRLFPALAAQARLDANAQKVARHALRRKDRGALCNLTRDAGMLALLDLYGEANSVLAHARSVLGADASIAAALDELHALARAMETAGMRVTVDLADIPSWGYHTGAVYALFTANEPVALARGGRYDNIGSAYGAPSPRPATGFSMDLRLAAANAEGR